MFFVEIIPKKKTGQGSQTQLSNNRLSLIQDNDSPINGACSDASLS
ncbi:hypothetical protein LEP1GSC163_2212 [Leptospira santarosai str. CBC379]|nr:hypothetical protein LEP1GSC163_2212 [Leptospira santarosai str. CBC379]